jgi:hypothetical protein
MGVPVVIVSQPHMRDNEPNPREIRSLRQWHSLFRRQRQSFTADTYLWSTAIDLSLRGLSLIYVMEWQGSIALMATSWGWRVGS